MEKNIELAIQKEEEYIQHKVIEGDNSKTLLDYLAEAGYFDLEDFKQDRFFYVMKTAGIIPVSDSATVLQPLAYEHYQQGAPFCYFVEYNKYFALVPLSFSPEDEQRFNEYGFDCFKCGYNNGGIILTDPLDFRMCIAIPNESFNRIKPYILNKLHNFLLRYYPDIIIDNNDFMYNGKKVAGSVDFGTSQLYIFAISVSFVDMYEYAEELGIIKDKIPGCLPDSGNLKDLLKTEVTQWLRQ